jgi:cytochrome bd-type quinol oxidase subunit 1
MSQKLPTLNLHLARAVLVAGAIFALSVSALAALTGETFLLAGTAFGVTATAYALIVTRQPTSQLIRIHSDRHANAA